MTVTTKELIVASREASRRADGGTQHPSEPHPADADYRPPANRVRLPSRGLVYPPESPLYLAEHVEIKAVSAKEENILSSPVLIRKGTVLSTLMRACITNRSIDPDQMVVGDRNAILTSIRISAYGPEYNVSVECPACHTEAEHSFDLSCLELKTLDVDPSGGPGSNQFEFTLPVSGRVVTFKLFDAKDVAELERNVEAVRKKTGQEQNVTLRLIAQVLSIRGVEHERLAATLVDLSARDSKALRNYMDRIAPGVEMTQSYECASCGKTTEVEVPMGTEFFWPSGG